MLSSLRGAPRWIDLTTTDKDQAKAFYGGLFGWTFTDGGPEFGHYTTVSSDGADIGGLMGKMPEMGPIPDLWAVYLGIEDAAATVAAARERGADVIVEPMDVGDLGVMAVVSDPGGAAVGLWQSKSYAGMEAVARPGAPAWFEVMSKDYEPTVAFYREVLGWRTATMADGEEFRYTTLGEGDEATAGICDASTFLPDEAPSHWRVYFAVTNTESVLERARELGGSVIDGPEDTPFGRMATLADDQGATFLVAGPTEAS